MKIELNMDIDDIVKKEIDSFVKTYEFKRILEIAISDIIGDCVKKNSKLINEEINEIILKYTNPNLNIEFLEAVKNKFKSFICEKFYEERDDQ